GRGGGREEKEAGPRRERPCTLTAPEREGIRRLADDLPALWAAPTTTPAERQRVVRLLLRRVVVAVQGESERVQVRLEWAGGTTSEHELIRPVSCYSQRTDFPELAARVRELRDSGMSLRAIAEQLNRQGFVPPQRTSRFTGEMVGGLLRRLGRTAGRRPAASAGPGEHEWWPGELASRLGMSLDGLRRWMRVGWVHTRRLPDSRGRWVVWAD